MTAPVHVLTQEEAHAVCCVLHAFHIDVTCQVTDDGAAVISPIGQWDTWQEVAALRAFAAVTDSVRWAAPEVAR